MCYKFSFTRNFISELTAIQGQQSICLIWSCLSQSKQTERVNKGLYEKAFEKNSNSGILQIQHA